MFILFFFSSIVPIAQENTTVDVKNAVSYIAGTHTPDVVWLVLSYCKKNDQMIIEAVWYVTDSQINLNEKTGGISFNYKNSTIRLNKDFSFILIKKGAWIHANFVDKIKNLHI